MGGNPSFQRQEQGNRFLPPFPNQEKEAMDLSNLPGKTYPAVPEDLNILENPSFPSQIQNPDQQEINNFQKQVSSFFQGGNRNSQQGIISV